MKRMARPVNSGCVAIPTKKQKMTKREDQGIGRLPDIVHLEMTTENVTKPFRDWTVLSAEHFYPEVGTKTYRVPALYFNHQNFLSPEQASKKKVSSLPSDSCPSCPSSSSSSCSSFSSSSSCPSPSSSSCPSSSSLSSCPSSSSPSCPSSSSPPSPLTSSSTASSATFPSSSEVIGYEDLNANHALGYADSCKSAASRRGELLQNNAEFAEKNLAPRLPDGEGRAGLEPSHPFKVCSRAHDNVGNVVGSGGGFLAASPLSHRPPSSLSDCTIISGLLNDACSESLKREFCVSAEESKNLTHDAECNAQKVSCFESVDDEADDKHKHLSESIVSLAAFKSKMKRRRRTLPKIEEALDKMQNSDNFEDDDQRKVQKTPFSSQEELSMYLEDGSTHRKDPHRILHPAGDENTPERHSSASNMLADTQSITEETQKFNTASQTPASKSRSAHVQPVQLIDQPQESMVRRDKAMTVVLDSFETLGKELEQEGRKGLFILSGVNYDNYLNRIPVQVLRECDGGYLGDSPGCRGLLDILILHEHVGVMLVQVKSVGGNKAEWRASDSEMVTVLKKVIKKVKAKSQKVTENLSKELILDSSREKQEAAFLTTIHVLALPFIPRRLYHKTLEDDSTADQFHDCFELKVLCKEDFEFSASLGRAMKTSVDSATLQARPPWLPHAHGSLPSSAKSPLFLWWTSTLVDTETRLSQNKIKEIVGRLCGIFSSMTAVPDAKYRKEVRTFGHCVSETAARYGAPCLTNGQYNVLQCQHRFVALCGPPGSGKSLMLTLKAVQWLEQGDHSEDHVVLACIGRTAVTPAHVRVLQENINQRRTGTGSGGHLLRVLYPLNKIPPENIEQEVAASVASLMTRVREAGAITKGEAADVPEDENRPTANSRTRTTDRLHFVLSDVEPEDEKTQRVLRALSQHPFVHSLWWSTSEPPRSQGAWPLFRVEELRDVTRRSPHVQRVLKRLEQREQWKDLYVSSSVESGLPTEGPAVVYIQHQRHLQELRQASSGSVHTRMEHQNQHLEQHQIHRRWEIPHRYLNGVGHERHSNGVGEHDPTLDNAKLFHLQQDQPGLDRRENRSRDPHHISHSRQLTLNSDRSFERVKGQDMLQDLQHTITEIQSMPSEEREVEGFASRTADDNSNSVLQQVGGNVDGDVHSPFWCDMCAEEVAGIVSYLITDSAIPNLSPFVVGETKCLKDSSKNKFGVPIKPRDILILTNFPRQKNGIKTSQEEEEEEDEEVKRGLKDYIMHSTLVQRLRKEVQLKVLTEASAGKIAFPRNSVVLTDARSARGLERKVVIYVPSGMQSIRCESSVSDNATETDPRAAFDEEPRLCSISGNSLGRKTHPLPMRGRLDASEDVILDTMNVPTETPWVEKSSVDPLIINESKQAGGLMFSGNRQDGSVDHTALDGQTEERSTSFVALNAGKLSDDDRSHLDSWFDVCNASDLEEDDESRMDTSFYSMDSYGETTSEPTSNDFTTDTLEYPEVVLTPTSREIAPEYDEADAEYYEQVDNIHLPTSHTCRTSNRQDQIPASLATTTNERLPCWLKDNKRTNRTKNPKLKTPKSLQQRHKQQRIELAEVLEEEEADGVVKEGEKADSSGPCDNLLDNLLSGLSDDSRGGLYVAAASCLAQLVVVIPEHL